jgi:hypothetical protein
VHYNFVLQYLSSFNLFVIYFQDNTGSKIFYFYCMYVHGYVNREGVCTYKKFNCFCRIYGRYGKIKI